MAESENPRCALCGQPVREVRTGTGYIWSCSHCGIENPPIVPISLQEVQEVCERAMRAIATLDVNKQAGWLAYILEGLDEHNDTMADYVLEDLKEAIEERLEGGRW